MIQNLKLDNIALEEDYNLFVKEDFEYFDIEITKMLKDILKKFDRSISFEENDGIDSNDIIVKRRKMRKAIDVSFLFMERMIIKIDKKFMIHYMEKDL